MLCFLGFRANHSCPTRQTSACHQVKSQMQEPESPCSLPLAYQAPPECWRPISISPFKIIPMLNRLFTYDSPFPSPTWDYTDAWDVQQYPAAPGISFLEACFIRQWISIYVKCSSRWGYIVIFQNTHTWKSLFCATLYYLFMSYWNRKHSFYEKFKVYTRCDWKCSGSTNRILR